MTMGAVVAAAVATKECKPRPPRIRLMSPSAAPKRVKVKVRSPIARWFPKKEDTSPKKDSTKSAQEKATKTKK